VTEESGPDGPLQLAIITGLSGAGRATAAKGLEDLGWYVVDNLPPALLPTMAGLATRSHGAVPRLAAGIDIRGRAFFADFREALDALHAMGVVPRIVFLEASDDALVRRFDAVRRPHPLQEAGNAGRLVEGITQERAVLQEIRGQADLVIDTSGLNVHELRATIDAAFASPAETGLHATVMSFGFKYGLPVDADVVADCRFLPNPHWISELRPLTGRDAPVRDYVLGTDDARDFLEHYAEVLRLLVRGYQREGKKYLTLAVGCTGGKHRSVAMSEALAAVLAEAGVETRVVHRDLGRE
jgi:UPF0042 nucleotide-binding protein